MASLQRFLARSPMPVSAAELFAWHGRPGAFTRLTPPFEPTRLVERVGGLEVGARTVIEVKMGPLWRRWVAVHTACVDGVSFTDTQLSGPFARWEHTHRMVPRSEKECLLEDDVQYALPLGLLGQLGGGAFAAGKLERMFAYRHALTRADLRRHGEFASAPRAHVVLAGGGGEIGAALKAFLTTGGHRVTLLERMTDAASLPPDANVVLHLHEGELTAAHVSEAQRIVDGINALPAAPRVLLGVSRTAYAPGRKDLPLVEESPLASDARGRTATDYEAALRGARSDRTRVVVLRCGAVVRGGAPMNAARAWAGILGRGGPDGRTVPWISLEDLLGLLYAAMMRSDAPGLINALAPTPSDGSDFVRRAGSMAGAGAELAAVQGEVDPSAAVAWGFSFLHPDLGSAVAFFRGEPRVANLAGK